MRNYAGTCNGICSYNLVHNFLIQLLSLMHFSKAFSQGNKAFLKVSSQNEIVPLLVIFHCYLVNIFLLLPLEKAKFFTCVSLVSFLQYSCGAHVVLVALVSHLCCTRAASVALVWLVSGTGVVSYIRSLNSAI